MTTQTSRALVDLWSRDDSEAGRRVALPDSAMTARWEGGGRQAAALDGELGVVGGDLRFRGCADDDSEAAPMTASPGGRWSSAGWVASGGCADDDGEVGPTTARPGGRHTAAPRREEAGGVRAGGRRAAELGRKGGARRRSAGRRMAALGLERAVAFSFFFFLGKERVLCFGFGSRPLDALLEKCKFWGLAHLLCMT